MRRRGWTIAILWAVTVAGVATADGNDDFDRLAGLAGDWVAVDADGHVGDEVTTSFRSTAGGSALVETMFPGTEHEMVSVYHRDGDDLVLTHYCHMGNQPFLRQVAGDEPGVVEFEHDGGWSLPDESAGHIHHARIRFVDADHVVATWTSHEGGAKSHELVLDLVRRR